MLDETVADGDLIAGAGTGAGSRRRLGGGGRGQEVLEGSVGEGFEGDELEIDIGEGGLGGR